MNAESPVWFTLGEGIINEVFYPRIDCANLREAGFLITGPDGFAADEQRDTDHQVSTLGPGVPAYVLTNTSRRHRFRITKTIFCDPRRPVLMIRARIEVPDGPAGAYRAFFAAMPHLVNQGAHNDAWVGAFRSVPLLLARRAHVTMAMGCSRGWRAMSCGYAGVSDGRSDVCEHGRLTACYGSACDGNVGLIGEVALDPEGGDFLIVIGFGEHADAAGHSVRASLLADADGTLREFVSGWEGFQRRFEPVSAPSAGGWDLYRTSLSVLAIHESKRFHGGIIASLAIPWGGHHGDQDIGGYHLIWPRDLGHAAMGYLAVGHPEAAQQALFYLMCTQNPEGNWTQNMWVDGKPNWTARQLDQTATFVLLADLLRKRASVGTTDPWPAIRTAAEYIAHEGPTSSQDRWEENGGYTPYTLAVAIAALVAAAGFAREHGDVARAERWLAVADAWNASIEQWLYVTDTPLAREVGVEGYYVRIAPPEINDARDLHHSLVPLKNHDPERAGHIEAWRITSPDVLALVRYGLRRADDPRIVNTVRVIDATLKCVTRTGPAWRRFNHDGYGETADGHAFLGAGIGRCWPVLTGERAHYELARGHRDEAEHLLRTMAAQAWHGLLPEQIWDAEDIPASGLANGEPTGSATPLVWAHAEFITLLRSLREGVVFDCPRDVADRYLQLAPQST